MDFLLVTASFPEQTTLVSQGEQLCNGNNGYWNSSAKTCCEQITGAKFIYIKSLCAAFITNQSQNKSWNSLIKVLAVNSSYSSEFKDRVEEVVITIHCKKSYCELMGTSTAVYGKLLLLGNRKCPIFNRYSQNMGWIRMKESPSSTSFFIQAFGKLRLCTM